MESLTPSVQARLESLFNVHPYQPGAALAAPEAEVVVTTGSAGVPRAVIEALTGLRLIAVNGVGTDSIDLALCRGRGIAVTNTPDLLSDDVADLAIAMMLSLSRQLPAADTFVRAGRWARGEQLGMARSLSGKRLGIFGLGNIGEAVASRAEAFRMQVGYCNRSAISGSDRPYFDSLPALAQWCHILVVTASGGPATVWKVDQAVFEALGPQGMLINVARGSIVDEAALVGALANGTIGGAGLDVFADEPNIPSAFLASDRVILAPHIGTNTEETRTAMAQLVFDNVLAHFAGAPLKALVA
jgi:lactate dehydrogenase-like 2-hydroxyacid dehydrogenase